MFDKMKPLTLMLLVGMLALSACNLPSASPTPQNDPNLIYTAAAETVAARLTEAAGQATPQPPPATDAPVNEPPVQTATQFVQLPTATNTSPPLPTATQAPPTATPIPCDRASFVKDVTYTDGTEVAAGTTFVKTWRLKNNGSCTWNSSYHLVFVNGDSMDGPASVQLTTGTVAPGQEIDVSVTLKAPQTPKEYTGNWKLRNGSGTVFGIGANAQSAFWVKVKVINPNTATPTVTSTPSAALQYNFVEKAPNAEWRNGTEALPWGDPGPDNPGVADIVDNAKLNDGRTYNKVLATFPQAIDDGVITGLFSHYNVQNGDHFRALVGFRENCANGKVVFQLNYVEAGGQPVSLREWNKSCDSSLLSLDVDLATLAGKSVQFMLAVATAGSPDGDKAVWVNPRIER